MEGPYAQPPPVPRLRLTRQPLAAVADRPLPHEDAHAGPSRLRDHVDELTDSAATDDDPQPTPRGPATSNATTPGEAAVRLRTLLKSMPNQPQTTPRPASPSEIESDFDPPRFSPPPSDAKKSLKDVFSYALRDPGDTPVKSRRIRRNSTSEVEDLPRQGAKNKGKRKSLSDEELEKPSRSSQRSETSLRISQAETYDFLREKLTNSRTPLKNEALPTALYDDSTNHSADTATFLRDLNSSRATPPVATSTPAHSMEMSANSKFQTNLMDHDSEMQHMMKDLDSYEGDSGPSRPVSFPPSRGKPTRPVSMHSHSHPSPSQSHRLSYNGTRPVSQASSHSGHSSQSGHDSQHDPPEILHEREREWNKPHPKAPPRLDRQHSHAHDHAAVNGHVRVRTRSGGSVEDSVSSKGNSVSSHSDYKERMHELEKERNAEREHAWNRPQASRSTSTLSVHSPADRSRKLSQPSRPGSSLSLLPPGVARPHSVASRPLSAASSHNSSRTSSDDEIEEIQHEIAHERERNWNAPIPHWQQHPLPPHHARPKSPMPPSSSPVSTPATLRPGDRVRATSLRNQETVKGNSPVHRTESPRPVATSSKSYTHETPAPQMRPRSLLASTSRPRPMSYPARPNSPLPPPRPNSPLPPLETKSKPKPAPPASQSTHKPSPQPRSPERDRGHSRIPSSPSPSPGQRPRMSLSHIPVRSPGKGQSKASNGHSKNAASSPTALFQRPVQVPKILEPEDESQNGDPFTETDREDHQEDRTPRLLPPPVEPPIEPPRFPTPPSPVMTSDEDLFQKALATPPPASPSPPPSPRTPIIAARPPPEEAPPDLLSTPPKRPSFSSSRREFQTPSPPHGLPDLPGPPSSDEETETERPAATPLRLNGVSDTTSSKTPRPPGAWASTPAPAPVARTLSLPAPDHDESDSQCDSGLATPVPSLSRASSFPAQTPKPPGGWVATPTPRKSILKVRFDPQPAELELSATEDFSSANGHPEESLFPATGLATPEEERVRTPELPTTPVPRSRSPSRSPRRSPSVRIVDEYGRPDKAKPAKSPKNRNKSAVRIVDAMGREVETAEQTIKIEVSDDVPLDHNEALRVVREGVANLAQELNEMDMSGDFMLDEDHLRKLDNASRAAREARDDLRQAYHNDRTAQLRASMRQSSNSQTARVDSRSPAPWKWRWSFFILVQVLLLFLAYRIQQRSAKELFLTTYYDPLYPDLHLYGINYVTLLRTPASLSNTLRQEGFKAFVASFSDMLFAGWTTDTRRRWGAEDMQSVRWTPT
ncbi:hypothetical protein DFH06DRAFT_1084423 [Mycena polygramma]|nr:hypothetical protein DFH06DRAFT_1084423 [Mycena polygramma]